MRIIFSILILSLPFSLNAERNEKWYTERAAIKYNGRTEVTMPDRTRCDIVTETHAIEVDFAEKWAEAIGQSLNYSFQTELKPGILLILREPEDERYLIRVQSLLNYHKIKIDLMAIRAWEER